MINPRQRPTLLQATRAATAFTTSLALPGGYTWDIVWVTISDKTNGFFCRIYPDQLAALGGLTAYPITAAAAQPQAGIRYITAASPHGLTAAGQAPGAYTIG